MKVIRVALLALALGTSPALAKDVCPEHEGWEEGQSPPSWVVSPPSKEGVVRVVDAGQSNLLPLAYPFHVEESRDRAARSAIRVEVARRLRSFLGKDADRVADAVPEKPTLVRKGFHLAPSEKGQENVPGSQTYTAWVLWEVPMAPLLEAVPEEKRAAARLALDMGDVPEEPAWEPVTARPAWVEAPPSTDGRMTLATVMTSDRSDVAKVDAWVVTGHLGWSVASKVRSLLGSEGAERVANAAESWRTPVRRALLEPKDRDCTAWTLWEVPLEALLDVVPPEKREAARALLAAPAKPR